MAEKKETQAEKNKRLEGGLKKAGKSFTPSAEVKKQYEARMAKKSSNDDKQKAKAVEKPRKSSGFGTQHDAAMKENDL